MIKLTAAAVIVIAVLFLLNSGIFRSQGTTFAEALDYFQKQSYTFELTFMEMEKPFIMRAKVWELGRMRLDCNLGPGVGAISAITDLNSNKGVILFHQNKTAVSREHKLMNEENWAGEVVSMCSSPISELWNVLDGSQEDLGEKVIEGQNVTGFRIYQQDKSFEYEITIWVESQNGIPYLVETAASPLDKSHPAINWRMENFDLDVELKEEMFSLEMPEGYTLAYQENLEGMKIETKETAEAKKIVKVLELAHQGKNKEAIEILLGVDWSRPIEFGKEPYVFSMTEKGYIALKAEDQKKVSEQIFSKSAGAIRKTVNEMVEIGKSLLEAHEYKKSESYFVAVLNLGQLMDKNPDAMVIVRLIGMSTEKIAIKEMVKLYELTGEDQKLKNVQSRFKEIEAETKKIKEQASLKGT
jgi:hypothetical protein